ncbi:hypothetical protein [Microbacterium sp. SORGH_AS_0888]|uniref:hypothetical protein n=1 Tax=Microbacterium sp. SORGH_AS_0888 TaxID=3041791 RepID=UPI00277E5C79|nr:hypothetical protein [Microbacterium sp. SORGH_AS_0888]MDQ1130572.1 hypothetical protein [Microbacterium sp. SORGH_AS_0888]
MRGSTAGERTRRLVAVAAVATGCALMLTGCFVIPLADGRSPFDGPGNPSFRDIADQYEPVTAAVEGVLPSDQWVIEPTTLTDNCEGPCNLSLGVEVRPSASVVAAVLASGELSGPSGRFAVPLSTDQLVAVVKAVVPVAAAARLRFSVEGGCVYGEDVYDDSVCTDLTVAGQQILGTTEEFASDPDFVFADDSFTVRTATRPADEILARLD